MKKKYRIIVGVVLFIIFVNVLWYLLVRNKYNNYAEKVPKNDIGINYIIDEEGYHYNVKTPNYLSLTGNLAITEKNDNYALVIWPSILKKNKYKYGVTITRDNEMYMVEVDETFIPIGDYEEKVVNLVNEHKEQLNTLLKKANNMWGILEN